MQELTYLFCKGLSIWTGVTEVILSLGSIRLFIPLFLDSGCYPPCIPHTDLLWNLEDFQHVYILICYLPNIDLKPTICQLEKRGKGHTKKEEKTI